MPQGRGLHSLAAPRENVPVTYKYWTVGDLAKFAKLYPHINNSRLAEIFGRSPDNLQHKAAQLKLRKTAACLATQASRFNGKQVPWNKGLAYRAPGAERTHFAVGRLPHNTRPLGYERVDSYGVLSRKVAETCKKEIDWRPVKDLTYIEHHGEIPAGRFVVHANRDRLDFTPANLIAVTRSENLNRNGNRAAATAAMKASWAKRKATPLARYLAVAAALMQGD